MGYWQLKEPDGSTTGGSAEVIYHCVRDEIPTEVLLDSISKRRYDRESWLDEVGSWKPLHVRYGNRRVRIGWWVGTQRQRLAFWLAPWLRHRAVERVKGK